MKAYNRILMGAAVIALASCSGQGDEPEQKVTDASPAVEATAEAAIAGPETRMTGTAFAANDAIGITCTKTGAGAVIASTDLMYNKFINCKYVCNGTKFSGSDTANTIFFQNTDEYQFSAYYPYNGSKGTQPTISLNTSTSQSAATQNSTLDVLFAEGAKGKKAAPGISFTTPNYFQHKMAKLVLNVTLDPNSGFSDATKRNAFLTNMKVSVNGLKHTGSFNTATGAVTVSGNATSAWEITSTSVAAASANITNGKSYTLILVPQAATTVTFQIVESGVTYQATASITPTAGQQITLPVTVKRSGLAVGSQAITNWGTGSSYTGTATM